MNKYKLRKFKCIGCGKEWDGEYWHTKPKRVLLDKSQDAYLKKCGYKVLRITDREIKNNIKEVYANITRTIQ